MPRRAAIETELDRVIRARDTTRAEVSRAAGLSRTAIRDMIHRTRAPKFDTVRKIAGILNVPVANVFDETGCPRPPSERPIAEVLAPPPCGPDPASPAFNESLLYECVLAVEQETARRAGAKLSPAKKAQLIVRLFRAASADGSIDSQEIRELIDLAT